jgi:hypothetical protein
MKAIQFLDTMVTGSMAIRWFAHRQSPFSR